MNARKCQNLGYDNVTDKKTELRPDIITEDQQVFDFTFSVNTSHQITSKIAKYKGLTPNGKDCIIIAVDSRTLLINARTDTEMKQYVPLVLFYREILYTVSKACETLKEHYDMRCAAVRADGGGNI